MIGAIARVGGITSTTAGNDVFSQKVGDWAWQTATPSTHNPKSDIPNGFSAPPVDALVMDYLVDFIAPTGLPVAHLYDSALSHLASQVEDPVVRELLEHDLALREYLRARRIGDVYE